ncbi:Cupin domain-containing protein [Pricia antarctica]|uniref:Cupin domain-containing protein n=1 Tax=Pricia antarctica TaxID=641691 RepID=A0A1G7A7G4_9FLAO|nr:cupin domain-containing protein [Pricia antarctica]SDE10623.1 Cupin domain-containing protein [Pricia antarctica]
MAINLSTLPSKEIMPGLHGKLVHTENMSLVFWEVEKGAEVHEHAHMNEQVMHVIEGKFELTLDDETNVYHPGDLVVIAPYKKHSGKALTPCKLMDVFSPVREEYK